MLIPTYRYSVSSAMPFDLNHEDHSHQLFSTTTNHHAPSSSSSLSYSILVNPHQDQGGSYYWKPKPVQSCEEDEKFIPSSGSWDHPAEEKGENSSEVLKKLREANIENLQFEDSSSVKWMPPKMRIKCRMMEDQKVSEHKFEKQKLPLSSPLGTDNSSSNNIYSSKNSNISVRVCADCHTTKTPLWRSGPTGPKTLCNACGIRQRKARRAIAAAAENGTILMAAEKPCVKGNKLQNKGKKSKTEGARAPPQLKRKRKFGGKHNACGGRNKSSLEELIISLSNNLAPQQVFPQDEKEAAILLMTLSYGLSHGFPSDCYSLDL